MFLRLSVSHSVHRGGLPQCMLGYHTPPPSRHPPLPGPPDQAPPGGCTPREQTRPPWDQVPPGADTPLAADGYCCGWYASYWNAFLSSNFLNFVQLLGRRVKNNRFPPPTFGVVPREILDPPLESKHHILLSYTKCNFYLRN